jgi:hypothetical protein
MTTNVDKYFTFAHLPKYLQTVAQPITELAQFMNETLPDGAEKSVGMRKLLEAKDCFVRAALDNSVQSAIELVNNFLNEDSTYDQDNYPEIEEGLKANNESNN